MLAIVECDVRERGVGYQPIPHYQHLIGQSPLTMQGIKHRTVFPFIGITDTIGHHTPQRGDGPSDIRRTGDAHQGIGIHNVALDFAQCGWQLAEGLTKTKRDRIGEKMGTGGIHPLIMITQIERLAISNSYGFNESEHRLFVSFLDIRWLHHSGWLCHLHS